MTQQLRESSMINKEKIAPRPWGSGCFSWDLVDRADMLVVQEAMPPGTAEVRHFHSGARQFFFVLSGELAIEVEGERTALSMHDGIEIAPGRAHQVLNESDSEATFLAVACPTTKGDRTPRPFRSGDAG
jgi:mannose-6-phosphate isomerase-like protein (cupin superfamily)